MTDTANIERGRAVSQPDSFAPVSVFDRTINPQRESRVAFDISRGSGAVRGNVRAVEAHGENRERSISSGHSETERGKLLAENYIEADLQYVTLKVWRPVKWVTDGGRVQASSPPFSQKARDTKSSRSNTATCFSDVLVNQLNSQRHGDAALDISRGSGAERGSRGPNKEAYGDYRQRLNGGHSETEQSITSAENCVQADLHNVTLEVWHPVTRATDGGRLQALSPPSYQTVGDRHSSLWNRATAFAEELHEQLKPRRHGDAVSNISRGSGAERGNVRAVDAHGENRERSISSGHSETEQGELIAENYIEANLHNVTLEVWRPVKWVTGGGRVQASSPLTFSTQEA